MGISSDRIFCFVPRMYAVILSVILLLLGMQVIYASGQWVSIGPEGGGHKDISN